VANDLIKNIADVLGVKKITKNLSHFTKIKTNKFIITKKEMKHYQVFDKDMKAFMVAKAVKFIENEFAKLSIPPTHFIIATEKNKYYFVWFHEKQD